MLSNRIPLPDQKEREHLVVERDRSERLILKFTIRSLAMPKLLAETKGWGDGLFRMNAIRIVNAFGERTEQHRDLESDLHDLYARRDAR